MRAPEPAPVADASDTLTACYRFDKGQQHNFIRIVRVRDSAWGELNYTFEEKDGRRGPFTGNFHGDTLWIMYDGMIEGTLERSEVVFLLDGDKIHEAQGTQQRNADGVFVYKHRKMLVFDDPDAMTRATCP
jgi:hypothetical protein